MNKTLFTKIFSASLIVMLALVALPVTPARAATITVTTNAVAVAVNGACSLPEAIANANNDAATNADCSAGTGADVIVFNIAAASPTITLAASLPNITDNDGLTIDGTNLNALGGTVTISGNNAFRIVSITGTGANTFRDLIMINGAVAGDGGAINNVSNLTIDNVTFRNNRGTGNNNGGALYHNTGSLSISNSTFGGTVVGDANYTGAGGGAIYIAGGAGTMTITNTTFQNNRNAAIDNGGAIYLNGGTLSINNSTFDDNRTNNGNGGAIYQNGGTLNVGTTTGNTFTGNDAFDTEGGGTGAGGAIYKTAGDMTIGAAGVVNSFNSNTTDGTGGAIYVDATGTYSITAATFNSNSAADEGGAIDNDGETATITGSTFTSNSSTGDRGGAISNHGGGANLTITSSIFTSNTAAGNDGGGAISNTQTISISNSTLNSNSASANGGGGAYNGGTMTITGSTLNANSVNGTLDGGAIFNDGGTLTAQNSTFFGNQTSTTAGSLGGAIYANGGTLNISFVSFSDNRASTGNGGAIHAIDNGATTLNLYRSYLVNSVSTTVDCFSSFDTEAVTNSLIEDNSGTSACGGAADTAFAFTLSLANNGGSTQTLAITPSMTGVYNAAAACTDYAGNTVNNDQRGTARPQGANCDLGAYEAPANTAPTVQALITDVVVNEDAANTVFSLYPNFQDTESADNLLTYTVTAISNTALFTAPAGALPIAIADPTNFTLDYAPNANGVSNVTIRATDPGGLFVEDTFQVTVNAVNDEPSFTASNPPAVNEDAGAQTVSGWATVASFGAPNESGQAVLAYNISGSTCGTLLSAGPAVSTAGVLTYTPAANANGTCNFNVAVQDNGGIANGGDDTSPTQNFTITVNAVNDAPTGGNGSVTTNEDVIYTFTLADLTTSTTPPYADVDGNLFAGIRVTSLETAGTLQCGGVDVPLNGTCADVTTLTFAPAANANGSPYATFQFQVYDGTAYSASSYTMTINVTAVNDEPSFGVSGPIPAVDEDAGAVSVPGWIVLFNRGGGPDEAGQTVLNWLVTNSTCGSLLSAGPSVAGNTLSYTTAANANGTCTFDLQVQDNGGTASGGDDTSPANNYTITVNAVNDAPSFTASNPPAVNEDAGAQTVNAWASFNPGGGTDESAQTATYSVTNAGSCATLLSAGPAVSTAGVLTYTPAANQNGSCTFDVSVQDSGSGIAPNVNTSGTQNFTITVNALNDNPTGGNDAVTMLEDTTYTFQTTDFTYNDVEGSPFSGIRVTTLESAGTLQCGGLDLNINDTCADVTTLTFAPVANENGAPYATFQFQVSDGGLFSTSSYTMTINVTAVNDEPSFTASNPPAVNEDAGAQNIAGWATFNPGNTSEAGQTATFNVSNLGAGCATLLTGSPTINASGDLSYTPATNQNGTCTFDVSVQDSGGTTNGGDDTSGTQNFTITVNAVNDEPAQSVAPDQFRTDAITVIPQGGLTNETSVVFKATAIDPEAQQYQLEVEVVSDINPFTGTPTCTSPLTNSGTEASTGSCGPFAPGSYIWRYRFVDSGSAASAWTVFGASDPDFIIDNGSPTVTNVTSSTANGTYFSGDIISIQVTFNEIVNVTGTPQLLLELGAVDGLANYVSGSGTNTLTFTYTIVVGDNTPDLDYVAANSLTLNGGSIQDAALNNASLTLPNPGSAGSLGANKDIVIDALILVVVNNGVGSVPDTGDGSLSENEQVASSLNITQLVVRFNKDVRDVPSSTTDPDEVDNPANYILVRSNTAPVGNFNTISCAGGVVAPDIQTLVTSVTYTNGGGTGPFEATLTLSAPLTTDGYYRLYVCGTTSIVQANNPTLALAGNNTTNGTDFIRNFQITTAPVGGGGNDNDNGPRLNVAALPATGFAPNRVTVLPEQPAERAYAELGDLWIEIPALGVKTSIVGVPQTAEGEWDVTWLANNVGWLNGTAFPTWEGNSVVTAHVTNADGLNGPFSNLKKLKFGDQIIVHAYGEKYTFEVRASRLTRPFATNYAFEDLEEHSYLTLITCQTYLPKTDTYLFRRVVRAVLVSVESE